MIKRTLALLLTVACLQSGCSCAVSSSSSSAEAEEGADGNNMTIVDDPNVAPDYGQQLIDLQTAHQQGLMTDSEYETASQKVIKKMEK